MVLYPRLFEKLRFCFWYRILISLPNSCYSKPISCITKIVDFIFIIDKTLSVIASLYVPKSGLRVLHHISYFSWAQQLLSPVFLTCAQRVFFPRIFDSYECCWINCQKSLSLCCSIICPPQWQMCGAARQRRHRYTRGPFVMREFIHSVT